MTAPALLRELERAGAVTIDDNGYVHVRMRSLSVNEDRRLAITSYAHIPNKLY